MPRKGRLGKPEVSDEGREGGGKEEREGEGGGGIHKSHFQIFRLFLLPIHES